MGLKKKQAFIRSKEYLEKKLEARKTALVRNGLEAKKVDRDPLVKKLKADIKTVDRGLKWFAANDKRTEDLAAMKVAKAEAARKEKEEGKSGKAKKAAVEEKPKKAKGEKSAEGKEKKPKAAPKKPAEAAPAPAPAAAPKAEN